MLENYSHPLTREEVHAKFHECAETLISANHCERIIALCEGLDGLASIRELTRHLGALPTTSTLDRDLTQ